MIFGLFSSPAVIAQVQHAYDTTDQIYVVDFSLVFLDNNNWLKNMWHGKIAYISSFQTKPNFVMHTVPVIYVEPEVFNVLYLMKRFSIDF